MALDQWVGRIRGKEWCELRHFFDTFPASKKQNPRNARHFRGLATDSGAGEGNRTLVMSLGSSGNAIIRRPLGRLLRPGRLFTRCAAAGEARGGVFVDFAGFFRQGSGAPRGGGG